MDAIARIKELMEERGWTLYRLSQESGIAITTLINLLHHSKQPALQTIEIICESMEITLAEFFTRPSEPGGFTAEQLRASRFVGFSDRRTAQCCAGTAPCPSGKTQ